MMMMKALQLNHSPNITNGANHDKRQNEQHCRKHGCRQRSPRARFCKVHVTVKQASSAKVKCNILITQGYVVLTKTNKKTLVHHLPF